MYFSLLLIPLFALCSGLAGWGKLYRFIPQVLSTVGACGIAALTLPWWAAIITGAAGSALFWGTMRRSWHAKAELDYMARKLFSSIFDVADSYSGQTLIAGILLVIIGHQQGDVLAIALALPVGLSSFLPAIVLRVYNYDTRIGNRLKNNGRFFDCRRPTELAGGAVGGICAAVLVYAAGAIW